MHSRLWTSLLLTTLTSAVYASAIGPTAVQATGMPDAVARVDDTLFLWSAISVGLTLRQNNPNMDVYRYIRIRNDWNFVTKTQEYFDFSKPVIVYVHGFSYGSHMDMSQDPHEIRRRGFADYLSEAYNIYAVEYGTGYTFESLSRELAVLLDRYCPDGRKVSLVAYSTGGCVARGAIELYGAWRNVDRYVGIGVPNAPFPLGRMADKVINVWSVLNYEFKDMGGTSDFFERLNAPTNTPCQYLSVYGTIQNKPEPYRMTTWLDRYMPQWDGIVPVSIAAMPLESECSSFTASGFELNHDWLPWTWDVWRRVDDWLSVTAGNSW